MPSFDEFFSVFKEFLPIITAGGAVVTAAGLIPRIGPGRAVWIISSFSRNQATEK